MFSMVEGAMLTPVISWSVSESSSMVIAWSGSEYAAFT